MKRFWDKVDMRQPDECWPWKGAHTSGGYGTFWPTRGRTWTAHRFAYHLVYGIQDESNDIHHTCNNRICVNFHHLEEMSPGDNTRQQDKVLKTHCVNGHERTKENSYYKKNGTRDCLICRRERGKKRSGDAIQK